MATPVLVQLACPLCGTAFQARTQGASYYIAGVDTDLRETGSIEEVRRFTVATCPACRFSDYSWNFTGPDELEQDEVEALAAALEVDPRAPGRPTPRAIGDFERLALAARCFRARGMDAATLAEVALLAYYVARDLGRRDLEPALRDEAAALFFEAYEADDPPPPLRLRYAYLAGELSRRAGRRDDALRAFAAALEAGARDWPGDLELGDGNGAVALEPLARRMQAAVLHWDAPAEHILELTRGPDPDVATEGRRLLAGRRDRASVEAVATTWAEAGMGDRTEILRELVQDPPRALFDLFVEALDGAIPEDIRLAARALGALGDGRAVGPLLRALERGVLSTEAALVEPLRRLDAPGKVEALIALLERWEAQGRGTGDPDADAWHFASDPTPIRALLYGSGHPYGFELLIRDLRRLEENDLWDKVPSGGPVGPALALDDPEVDIALRGLLAAERAPTRRWAAFCLAERRAAGARDDLRRLLRDPDRVVRLQAGASLARLGDASAEGAVLSELRGLGDDDLPFALHFLVPFSSPAVRALLLEVLERGVVTPGEVLPLLGRQPPDARVTGLLHQGLLDTNDDARAGAVTGVAYQGGAEIPGQLRALYDGEVAIEVQRRIVFGLGHLARRGHGRDETLAFLRARLGRGNPPLRFAIALTLLNLDDPSGLDIVRERAALFDESYHRNDVVSTAQKRLA